MSSSPPKEGEAESEVAPPVVDAEQDQEENGPGHQDPPMEPDIYGEVKEQDRWLPIANVARIMKTALPDNAKIAKEAKECMQECVSEFISFITSEASEKCQMEKRKTVNGEDILFAMSSTGFENYSAALKIYLSRYRESNTSRNENDRNRPTSGHGPSAPGDVLPQGTDRSATRGRAARPSDNVPSALPPALPTALPIVIPAGASGAGLFPAFASAPSGTGGLPGGLPEARPAAESSAGVFRGDVGEAVVDAKPTYLTGGFVARDPPTVGGQAQSGVGAPQSLGNQQSMGDAALETEADARVPFGYPMGPAGEGAGGEY